MSTQLDQLKAFTTVVADSGDFAINLGHAEGGSAFALGIILYRSQSWRSYRCGYPTGVRTRPCSTSFKRTARSSSRAATRLRS